MASSIRERAVTALVTRLKNQVKGAPSGVVSSGSGELAEYDFHWDAVVRYPLGDKEQQMHYALAVLEIDETKSEQIQTVNSLLNLELNFRVFLRAGDEPAEKLNSILMNIQRQIRSDITLGGLIIDIRETGNVHTVESFEDRQVEGSVFVTLQYKHAENDPREQIPGSVPS